MIHILFVFYYRFQCKAGVGKVRPAGQPSPCRGPYVCNVLRAGPWPAGQTLPDPPGVKLIIFDWNHCRAIEMYKKPVSELLRSTIQHSNGGGYLHCVSSFSLLYGAQFKLLHSVITNDNSIVEFNSINLIQFSL